MRISLDHFIYCIVLYKCKTIVSICGSIFSFICTVLGIVSKRSLIASVTIVHGLDRKEYNFYCFGTKDLLVHIKCPDLRNLMTACRYMSKTD